MHGSTVLLLSVLPTVGVHPPRVGYLGNDKRQETSQLDRRDSIEESSASDISRPDYSSCLLFENSNLQPHHRGKKIEYPGR